MTDIGISRRAFARTRGISEARVRGLITEGVLADAVLPSGLIDAKKADRLIAASLTRAKNVPVTLSNARARRDRALALTQEDELRALRKSLVPPAIVAKFDAWENAGITKISRRFPARTAAMVFGKKGHAVYHTLNDAMNALLTELHTWQLTFCEKPPEREPEPEANFDGLTPVELKAVIANQQAEKLELERALSNGRLMRLDDSNDDREERQSVSLSLFRALAGRVATLVAHATTLEEVERLIAVEIEGCLAVLVPQDSKQPIAASR